MTFKSWIWQPTALGLTAFGCVVRTQTKVVAAAKRLPAFVIGDGKRTVLELVAEKNKVRR